MSEAGAPRRLHPATLVGRWLRVAPQAAAGIVAAGLGTVSGGRAFAGIVLMIVIAAIAALLFVFLAWWRFTYTIGENEIVIEKGLLQRQRRVIPFDRVQDIAIEQPLLARLFGTARVKIETGGSASDEGRLDMIGLDDARALRDHVRRERVAGAAAGAPVADVAGEPLLFALTLVRLLVAGLFNFSLVFLAAIMGGLQYLEQLNLFDWEEWLTGKGARDAAAALSIRGAALLIGLVLLLGMVAGVVRTVARDFGFRLTRAPAGFRRRRGLVTLSEAVIPIRRTQAARIESGIAGRIIGWRSLAFQTLGADRKEGGVQAAAPFARPEEIAPILAEAGFPEPPPVEQFHRLPRRALIRRATPWLALAALVGFGAWLIEPLAGIGAGALLLAAGAALLRWRKAAYAIGEQALFVTGGLIRRRLWILPFERAQVIQVARGPVQRRLSLASLRFDTAGAPAMDPPDIVDLDEADARRLAAELLRRFHEARAKRRLQPA
ncbi:PH domain-containing protein [Sphingosinicella sp.]|uniref:PH domain-containing protein n=1 Tax=Sphingosinicella sp. TaxID=1917971 RepID=UPI004038247A